MAQLPCQPKLELVPETETQFFVSDVAAELEFGKDERGQCTQAKLRQSGFEYTLKKIK